MTLYCLLSFDDTTELDVKAAKLLEKYCLKGTFFLDTGRIGKQLTIEELKWISQFNEVRSHTVTHRNLTKLTPEEVLWELTKSKRLLESITGKHVFSFAYPYGVYNKTVMRLVAKVFLCGRTVKPFNFNIDKNPYMLKITLSAAPLTTYRLIREDPLALGRFGYLLYRIPSSSAYLKKWNELVRLLLLKRLMSSKQSVFHLLIHANELENKSEWIKLEDVLNSISSIRNKIKICTISDYISNIFPTRKLSMD